MSRRSLYCISSTENQASEIINQLKQSGFSTNDISALLPDKTGTKDFIHEHHTKAPEGAATGAIMGGIICGVMGLLLGMGQTPIPGLTQYLAAGPIMTALSGLGIGMVIGGSLGALFGLGVPEYEARRYQGKIRSGNILISVHCETYRLARRARRIFREAGAYAVASSGEARGAGFASARAAAIALLFAAFFYLGRA